jgi:3-oxoacyl-[acyl-carrier protein] reductase
MNLGLKGKIAIVTGGTEGIGKATAFEFAREGAKVAICSRRADVVKKTIDEIKRAGGDAFGMAADMSKMPDIERFIDSVVKQYGGIDILVNNAGYIRARCIPRYH